MNEQLTSDELRQVLADWIRPMYTRERRKLAGLFEAVIARAETAEAEARDARNDLDDAELHLRRAEAAATALVARVAELEAASEPAIDRWASAARSETQLRLDAAEARVAELESQLAAQGWRPLGAPPASTGEYLIGADYIPDVLLAEYHADTDMWYQQLPDGEWQLADWATHWRPLPPAPQETE